MDVFTIAVGILATVLLLAFLTTPNTIDGVEYSYVEEVPFKANTQWNLGNEGATTRRSDGIIEIYIKKNTLAKNLIIRHENCHAEQFLNNRSLDEIECYIKAWIP